MDTQASPALLAVFAHWATPCQGRKDWKLPRKRRRMLIKLGVPPEEVKKASRSRKGYWSSELATRPGAKRTGPCPKTAWSDWP